MQKYMVSIKQERKTLGFEKGREHWTVQTVEEQKQEQNKTYLEGRKRRLDLADMSKNWQDESGAIFCMRMF